METYQYPITRQPHWANVKDKRRNSGLTSCRFYKDGLIVCCDFNEQRAYLARLGRELVFMDSVPTRIRSGVSVETDLMDLRGDFFIVSNFYQGSVSLYCIEGGEKIVFLDEINLSPKKTNMHGVRFVPGYDDLIWVTYCGIKNKCHEVWDIKNKVVLHSIETDEQCQDVAFLGGYAVVFARTNHIWLNRKPAWWSGRNKIYATAYVYSYNDLLTERPVLVSSWRGEGHLDAVKECDGFIYAANQYLDRVDVFCVDLEGRLWLKKSILGFGMPHGLDVLGGRMAVTNYTDQTLRLLEL